MTDSLHDWVDELAAALQVDASLADVDVLLDLARDAAHQVARPAAPLTAFLVGLAAGREGTAQAVTDAVSTAHALLAERLPGTD